MDIEYIKARCREVAKADAALKTGPSAASLALDCIASLEVERDRLREALHEIYSKACQATNEEDDMYLYSFARDARDIALNAHKALRDSTD